MNECFFFIHLFFVLLLLVFSIKLGKFYLMGWTALQILFANLFVVKQIDLFGLTVTCSDVFIVGTLFGLNLLQEFFDKETAEMTIKLSFLFLLFFLIMVQMHLLYIPSHHDISQSSFVTIFSSNFRITLASLIVFWLVQKFDISFYQYMKKLTQGKKFWQRLSIALTISQFLDTILFSFLGLYGIVASISNIIFVSSLIKILASIGSTFFIVLCRKTRMLNETVSI